MNSDVLFRQADEAYEDGDFEKALVLFMKASEAGDCHAMTRLAIMHECGEGTVVDISKSIEWDLKAIAAGSISSMLNLGLTYRKLGNSIEAKKWFEKALEQGDGEAAFELAKLYDFEKKEAPMIKKYLTLAANSVDLSESTEEAVREWLSRI